jgi:outer membrane scaffolding protein for murein synthesis (MipA/OmpV family)
MILGARDSKSNFEQFPFGKAFKAAFVVGLVSVAVSFSYNLVFNNVIDTELSAWMYESKMNEQLDKLEEAGMDDETIAQSMKGAEMVEPYVTGNTGLAVTHFVSLFWYLILALIIGAVQKDKKEEDLLV